MFLKTIRKFHVLLFVVIIVFSTTFSTILADSSIIQGRPRRLQNVIKHDIIRYKGISHKAKLRLSTVHSRKLTYEEDIPIEEREAPLKSTIQGSVKLPMYAAADYEMGEYVVDIDVGNPPTKLRLVVDTGSDLTWVKCKKGNRRYFSDNEALNVDKSLTYKPISCESALCKEEFTSLSSLDICPNVNAPCLYNYSYGDNGLWTYGMFGKDITTLPTTTGKPVKLPKLLIGCSESFTDKDTMKHADGVLGLGINPYAFSLHAVVQFGGSFSYCLVDHLSPTNVTNYLIFGDYKEKAPTQEFMRYTALLVSDSAPYYWLNVKGISLNHRMLNIDPIVWDRDADGGTILDSGTAATYWAEPTYRAIMDVLVPALEKDHPKIEQYRGDGKLDFEYCFNSTATPFNPKQVPRLEIHFMDGARFKPLVKSYIVDDGPDISCIGFLEAPTGLNVIGNIMQQNYLWEFDLHQHTIGFVSSTCD
ncbi:aspartic proteinase CDR1-like [Chenopodium quinoa]|uniref:aspartic proteinase CDR1-like n=1 Tax=Chenopodium quinoa TaxID=63459 RepID=UPI000B795A5B|nr:aspartic proteinase CDR1-like [Chenopodium quinoa]